MKHFLLELTYTQPFEQIRPVVAEHRAFLDNGYSAGILLMSGPRADLSGGILIARAESLEDLTEFFKNDPYNLKGMASYRWTEFDPVKRQPFLDEWVGQ